MALRGGAVVCRSLGLGRSCGRTPQRRKGFHLSLDQAQRLPARRVGRLWKFKLSQIDEWVRSGGAAGQVRKHQPVPELSQDRLDTMLSAAFEVEPVEDGIAHPAEHILEDALHTADQRSLLGRVGALCADTTRSSFAASTLRCLGRLHSPGSSVWRAAVIRAALASPAAELRDAAVQAAESWGDPQLVQVLRSHRETEPWLSRYVREVIEDLGA